MGYGNIRNLGSLLVRLSGPAVQQLWTLYPGKQTANLMAIDTNVTAPVNNFKRWQEKMFFYLTTLNLARFLNETAPQVEPPVEPPTEEDNKLAQKNTYVLDSAKANMVVHDGSSSKSISKAKGKGKKKNDKKGKGKAEYLDPKARIVKQKFQGTCYNCDQPGHCAANCKMPKRVNPLQANMVNDNVDMIAMVSDVIAMISEVNLVAVDNGEKLYMGNSATADIKGEGDVILKMTSEKELKLTNSDKFVLSKNQMYVGKGYAVNGMFKLNVMVVKNDINKMNSSAYLIESSNVWHGRLGHNCYVYLLKITNEAIDKFVLYKTEVENQLGRKIKVVRSERGGEYVSPFAKLCAKHGIRHEFTAPYSPQQNGIAEKKNRTLKEMVNAMLISSGLSQDMWGEAILTATYLLNKIPHIQKNAVMESRNASFFENIFSCLTKEIGSSSRLDDEVVQDKRQRDDNDLHDERQDQLEEEEVEPRRSKRARTEKSFGPDFVSFMVENDATSYREAVTSSKGHQWKEAIKSEINSFIVDFNDKMIKSTKDMLKSKFDMKDMGLADVILGIKIIRIYNGLVLSQAHYVNKILNTHNAGDSGLARTLIDTSTRPDLAYAVSRLSRYTSNPSVAHWKAMTRVLHYMRYSRDYGLHYDRYPGGIKGYNDANWISAIKDSRSTIGYVFTLGGAAISWKSSKQTVIAKYTMESEYIALDKCTEEAEWLRQFVEDIPRWPKPVTAISIHCDSQSAIGRAHSTMYNEKSRHIRRRHNSIRQLLSTGVISIDYVKSKDNIADPLTKGLSKVLVSKSSKGIGLKPLKE
ncbi:retrotransposon protein, putative, ty1-copia subclass [Tanacetum coccineum]